MADPLSITASVIAILQLSQSVVTVLTSVYDASEDGNKIMTEITSVTGILYHLKDLAERAQWAGDWPGVMQTLTLPHGPIDQLKCALVDIYSKVKPAAGLRKVGRSFVWPFQKGQVKDLLTTIEHQKSLLLIAMQIDHM